ncbi:MarC family protein [Wenxinia saemankumensis]|uniref:UPF0056 membrane protein n=1 Tax=Wenxinia saemankumensis TaxID=1447782 RepID=A0A1M6HGZ2_9RHOB|nr:MarC family protein [Wenxinia saemankumensis]SHJ21445.1 multiple antibiotic resistance protein [Wenxinia saemankumensis]
MPDISFTITAFVTLFVIMDPIGLMPVFVALTAGMDRAHRRAVAIRAAIVGAVILTVFGLFGDRVLGFIGISLPAFRIAGGILLFLTALDMLFERRAARRQDQSAHPSDDPSVFPIAMPLIAGPGAIASMILLTGQTGPSWEGILVVHAVMFAVVLITLALFLAAPLIERMLGETGVNVVSRLLGMLLAALSVQFVIDGVLASIGG